MGDGLVDALLTCCSLSYLVAIALQRDAKQPANLRLIIDYEHDARFGSALSHNPGWCMASVSLASGKSMLKTTPPLGLVSTQTCPPWASTKPLTSDRPRPV